MPDIMAVVLRAGLAILFVSIAHWRAHHHSTALCLTTTLWEPLAVVVDAATVAVAQEGGLSLACCVWLFL